MHGLAFQLHPESLGFKLGSGRIPQSQTGGPINILLSRDVIS